MTAPAKECHRSAIPRINMNTDQGLAPLAFEFHRSAIFRNYKKLGDQTEQNNPFQETYQCQIFNSPGLCPRALDIDVLKIWSEYSRFGKILHGLAFTLVDRIHHSNSTDLEGPNNMRFSLVPTLLALCLSTSSTGNAQEDADLTARAGRILRT